MDERTPMQAESIGYLFSTQELAAMMMLAGVSRLPGIDIGAISKEDARAGLHSLEKSRLIQQVDDIWIASRPISLVMRAMSLCDWFFSAQRLGTWAACYTGQGIFVSARSSAGGHFVVTPFPDGDKAWEDMRRFLPKGELKCTLAWRYRTSREFTGNKMTLAALTYADLDQQAALNGGPQKAQEDIWKV